jgi:hypothetical protein
MDEVNSGKRPTISQKQIVSIARERRREVKLDIERSVNQRIWTPVVDRAERQVAFETLTMNSTDKCRLNGWYYRALPKPITTNELLQEQRGVIQALNRFMCQPTEYEWVQVEAAMFSLCDKLDMVRPCVVLRIKPTCELVKRRN